MRQTCIITSFCAVRDNKLILDGKLLYESATGDFTDFASRLYKHSGISYPKFHKMDNLCKLGFITSEFLLKDKELSGRYAGVETGIILMNSSSSLDTDRNHQNTISDRNEYFPSPSVFVYTLPNVVIGEICIRHKIYGEGNFFISEKFNSLFVFDYVSQLFNNNLVECCITGWVEINGSNYRSVLYLIEKTGKTESGIANFEPAEIEKIYNRK
jgi:hypothetical protein